MMGNHDHQKNNHNVVGIIQARMDSHRLPGKALIEVNGLPLIGYVFKRARKIVGISEVILATTDRQVDDPLVDYARSEKVSVYRGSCDDVALRMLNCAKFYQSDFFVRINGDSPFLDPDLITHGISITREGPVDLVTNLIERSFPYGIALEIVNSKTYEEVYKNLQLEGDREHVTQYFYDHIYDYKIRIVKLEQKNLSAVRLVVDTQADLDIFTILVEKLGNRVVNANYIQVASEYLTIT